MGEGDEMVQYLFPRAARRVCTEEVGADAGQAAEEVVRSSLWAPAARW
ncbi:hypothetical protein [Streptomyces sp. x-19]